MIFKYCVILRNLRTNIICNTFAKQRVRLSSSSSSSSLLKSPASNPATKISSSRPLPNTVEMAKESKSLVEVAKKLAAYKAVDEHIKDNQIVGIGSGSTVVYAVERIAERVKTENLNLTCIPTSFQAKNLIIENNLRLSDLDADYPIDVTIDGCDECDDELNLIKGGGGCLLQEKIVASASKKLVVVADYTKDSAFLGEKWKKGIPLEVSQIGWKVVVKKLSCLFGQQVSGTEDSAKLRLAIKKMGPIVTDNSNFIVDFQIGDILKSGDDHTPATLEATLKTIPGILETGLFVGMASQVYFGLEDGTVKTKTVKRPGNIF